jgi:hypothetical protein
MLLFELDIRLLIVICLKGDCNELHFKVWEPLREKFGRVVTADMAGFGFSDKPVSDIVK